MSSVLGRRHPAVRRIRELRRDRRLRDREGVLLAEGIHLAEEALACGARIDLVLVSDRLERGPRGARLVRRIEESGAELAEVADSVLKTLQDARSPQPVLMVVRRDPRPLEDVVAGRPGTTLLAVAHEIHDPGNLGSVVRTADAAGATGFVVSGGGVDLYHPRAVRATQGSIFRLPCAIAEIDDLVAELRRRRIATVAADPRCRDRHDRCDLTGPVALFLGAEAGGLPPALLRRMDRRVGIPMSPGVDSLSVGAAAAILLYEAVRQRSRSPSR